MRSAVLSSCHAIAWRSTESRSVPSRSKIAAFGNSQFSVAEASKARVPVSIRSVLRHMPVEIRPAIVPLRRTAFAERPLDFVDGHVGGCFRLAVRPLLGAAYRPPSGHQPANEIGSL